MVLALLQHLPFESHDGRRETVTKCERQTSSHYYTYNLQQQCRGSCRRRCFFERFVFLLTCCSALLLYLQQYCITKYGVEAMLEQTLLFEPLLFFVAF